MCVAWLPGCVAAGLLYAPCLFFVWSVSHSVGQHWVVKLVGWVAVLLVELASSVYLYAKVWIFQTNPHSNFCLEDAPVWCLCEYEWVSPVWITESLETRKIQGSSSADQDFSPRLWLAVEGVTLSISSQCFHEYGYWLLLYELLISTVFNDSVKFSCWSAIHVVLFDSGCLMCNGRNELLTSFTVLDASLQLYSWDNFPSTSISIINRRILEQVYRRWGDGLVETSIFGYISHVSLAHFFPTQS